MDERELDFHLSTFDTFESGKFVAESVRSGPIPKIAVVYKLDGETDAKFWETVAVNRGAQVKIFEDIKDAEEWLR